MECCSKSTFHSENSIIIGNKLAEYINISIGEDLIIFNPENINTYEMFEAKIFNVASTFQTNFPEYDRLLAFMPLKTAQNYFDSKFSGLMVNVDNPQELEKTELILSSILYLICTLFLLKATTLNQLIPILFSIGLIFGI